MKGSCRTKFALILALIPATLGLLSVTGCRGVEAHSPASTLAPPTTQQLPFTGTKPLAIPANTEIYVRLQQDLSSATAQEGQNFNAVLDQPVVLENQTIAPEGSRVTGTVVSVRDAASLHGVSLHNSGYLRITLNTITLNGKSVPLQTNSVFIGGDRKHNIVIVGGNGGSLLNALAHSGKGTTVGKLDSPSTSAGKREVGFTAEHRLGFRLTSPLNL